MDGTAFCCITAASHTIQGRHGEFEPGKAQHSAPIFFHRLFLIRVYWYPKSRQGPGLGGLASRGGPGIREEAINTYGIFTN